MKILITGAAGFIGYHLCELLLKNNYDVVGLDNINDYYSKSLKYSRLQALGIDRKDAENFNIKCKGSLYDGRFSFVRMDLEDREALPLLFENEKFDVVCNLAAQAGVRYSIENPNVYVDSNIIGFLNLLECCRHNNIDHLIYASSSSVYGLNDQIPFSTTDKTDTPISLYAATKKSNELMAHTYSHLYGIPTTGLRFFTVYGPWGRPDMAIFLFTEAILKGNPIKVFNNGHMERDFTYVGDIVKGVLAVLEENMEPRKTNKELYKLYNIGNNKSVKLLEFINEIELNLDRTAIKEMLPMQPGDVEKTWANVDNLIKDYDYYPDTTIQDGVKEFVQWYRNYYKV
ncbi:NAD-dependent epimerase [Maribacter luteus]|uniref:NAD-dependent epimerase/dehydratase family protein n=1 Tax=Maribacter luteus TaxID=2594478 RepID=A0A6I2MIV8_9FLAO|nr:NAD-dependent epimerase [Maribacter luteus]MRX63761.1 NAD-dependent epimerase/dehydratase family protein [Maribacter luteus]